MWKHLAILVSVAHNQGDSRELKLNAADFVQL